MAGRASHVVRSPKVARGARLLGACGCVVSLLLGCRDKGPALSHGSPAGDTAAFERPDLGPVDDPARRLGALVDLTPIFVAAHKKSALLGHLHAGETIARSERSHENDQCPGGWYGVAPHGYVCAEQSATTNLEHPTLRAMGLVADPSRPLPYTYARTSQVTALYTRGAQNMVEPKGQLPKSTVMAIVGSWTAPDESREPQRLGLLTDGRFVRADDLSALSSSEFTGIRLSEEQGLPVGYVVRRGVSAWRIKADRAEKLDVLDYHERLPLTGRFRTVQGERFWAVRSQAAVRPPAAADSQAGETDGAWVRHKDATVIRRRHEFPAFAVDGQKWIDVSVITGIAVAYEGKDPVFATLVSVGRDRTGDPKLSASTARGTFRVVSKYVTRRPPESADAPMRDAPWALELESGQWLHAAPHHDRFGIEHTDGNIEVSPQDGQFLFQWSAPAVPPGWHGIIVDPAEATTIVEIRK